MILYDFIITLKSQKTGHEISIPFTSSAIDYKTAWKEATEYALGELSKRSFYYYVKSINNTLC